MNSLSARFLLLLLIFIILLYDGVESKRGGGSSSSSRGSSGSRSSSSGGWGSSSSKGSSSGSRSSSSSSYNWGSSSSSRSSSGSGSFGSSRSSGSHSYGSSGRGWSNRYNGNTYVVMQTHNYYRGGGYGTAYSTSSGSTASNSVAPQQPKQSESPTITTDMIRDALFLGKDRIPSKDIFNYDKNDFGPQKEEKKLTPSQEGLMLALKYHMQQESIQNPGAKNVAKALADQSKDKTVSIKDEQRPVLVGSIAYFWGNDNVPNGVNGTNCADFSPANAAANFTVCNITSMIRCHKSLADVVIVGKKPKNVFDTGYRMDGPDMMDRTIIINDANGTMADQLAWFCPASDKCCEWECCGTEEKAEQKYDPPDEDFRTNVHVLLILGSLVTLGILTFVCCKCADDRNKKQAERAQLVQRARERRPLTAVSEYPKQSRDPHGANYGWNLAPSAPPMPST